ncbi:hypothetical protein IJD44_02680 [bacterium]|nr:hypothetical protein [bacterium]
MQHNSTKVLPIEKIISILSYLTMGIVGLFFIIIAFLKKQKVKFFLMYNIAQSMVISIFLALIKLGLGIILEIIAKIPYVDYIAAIIYYILNFKVLRIYLLNITFTIPELLVTLLIGYIVTGIILGRIFYIPFLSDVMSKTMKNYN